MARGVAGTSIVDDRKLLAAVRALRAEHGACTYRALAERLELPFGTVLGRCRVLLKQGVLESSSVPGSLRPAARRK